MNKKIKESFSVPNQQDSKILKKQLFQKTTTLKLFFITPNINQVNNKVK